MNVNASHELVPVVHPVSVAVNDLGLDINWVPGFVEDIIIDSADLPGMVEDAVADIVQDLLADQIRGLFDGLDLNQSFEIPAFIDGMSAFTVDLAADFESIQVTSEGLAFLLRTKASAPSSQSHPSRGSLGRENCANGGNQELVLPSGSQASVSLSFDTLNQIFFAAWRAGILEFDMPESMLADVDLSEMGITDLTINLSGKLPPVLSDCNSASDLKVFLGGVRISADMKVVGQDLHIESEVAIEADMNVDVVDGEVALSIGEFGVLEADIRVPASFLGLKEQLNEILMDTILPELRGALENQTLGSIALPVVDLGGVVIDITVDEIDKDGGNLIIKGDF
jgi:hypothetical protein